MREVGVEIVGQGALKLTGFLRELMQQRNISFESLYTVRTIKEVCALICTAISNSIYAQAYINPHGRTPLRLSKILRMMTGRSSLKWTAVKNMMFGRL